MLSARGEEEDRLVGFETGADDYVVKPFSPREVVLRVEALLRRAERLSGNRLLNESLCIGDLTIDLAAHVAKRGSSQLSLTSREFDLLAFLAANPGQTFSKADLLRRVWGWDFGDTSTVTVHVRRLREKLEDDPSDPTHRDHGRSLGLPYGPGGRVDMTDLLLITALTLAACVAVGLLGALLLRAIRRSSLRYQLAVATLIPVLAVAATVVINVGLMFLSAHDTTVILLASRHSTSAGHGRRVAGEPPFQPRLSPAQRHRRAVGQRLARHAERLGL
jgi:CheY-like chemotaxis protein